MMASSSEMDLWDLRNSLACPHRPPERARATSVSAGCVCAERSFL